MATANTALVRTEQRLSVRVQGYLPPHNFTVVSLAEAKLLFNVFIE